MRDDAFNTLAIIAIIFLCLVAVFVFRASSAIGVDFKTGFSMLVRATVVLVVAGVLVKMGLVSIGAVLPAVIGGFVWSFLPALDYWALELMNSNSFASISEYDYESAYESAPIWYARWYSQAAFVLVPIFSGYGIRQWLRAE